MRSGMFAVLAYCLVGSYLLGESGLLAGLPNFGPGEILGPEVASHRASFG